MGARTAMCTEQFQTWQHRLERDQEHCARTNWFVRQSVLATDGEAQGVLPYGQRRVDGTAGGGEDAGNASLIERGAERNRRHETGKTRAVLAVSSDEDGRPGRPERPDLVLRTHYQPGCVGPQAPAPAEHVTMRHGRYQNEGTYQKQHAKPSWR